MSSPRITIPTALASLDEDAYPLGGGTSSPSVLGVKLAQNSRCLHANLRRSWGYGFPLASAPVIYERAGVSLGAWPVECTPGLKQLAWYLEAKLTAGHQFEAVAYTEGPDSPQPWSPALWLDSTKVTTWTGTGSEATYGPIYCAARGGPLEVGLALRPLDTAVTPSSGTVLARHPSQVIGTATLGVWGTPPAAILRLTDGVGAAVPGLTDWHQITRGSLQTLVANDTVEIWPPFSPQELRIQPPTAPYVLGWQIYVVYGVTLNCLLLNEQRLT